MGTFDHMKSADELAKQVHWKGLVYGATGSGKTWFSASFERPLIALTEPQGLASIQEANPRAVPFQSAKTGKGHIDCVAGIEALKAALRDPELPDVFDAVVVDSLTEIQRIYKDAATVLYKQHLEGGGKTNAFWVFDKVLTHMVSFCRAIRNAPVHASVICLERKEKDSDGNVLRTVPKLEGGIRGDIGQFFNTVAYMQKRRRKNGTRHELNFNAGVKYETKTMTVLDDIECPEPLFLLQKRFGGEISDEVQKRVDAWRAMDEDQEEEDK